MRTEKTKKSVYGDSENGVWIEIGDEPRSLCTIVIVQGQQPLRTNFSWAQAQSIREALNLHYGSNTISNLEIAK